MLVNRKPPSLLKFFAIFLTLSILASNAQASHDPIPTNYASGAPESVGFKNVQYSLPGASCLTLSSDCYEQHVAVNGYRYRVERTMGGYSAIEVWGNVQNRHPQRTVREVELSCRIVANGSIEIFSGLLSAEPNLISGAAHLVRFDFVSRQLERVIPNIAQCSRASPCSGYEERKEYNPRITVNMPDVSEIRVNCDQGKARF